MNRFLIVLVSFVVFIGAGLKAQTGYKNIAIGGGNGIYISAGFDFPSKSNPVKNKAAYRIERKPAAADGWIKIAELSAPSTETEFLTALKEAVLRLPEKLDIENIPYKSIWTKFTKYRKYDSLGYWAGNLAVQQALGIMFVDESAEMNTEYEYKVSGIDTTGGVVDSYNSFKVSFPQKANFKQPAYFSKFSNGKRITVKWQILKGKKPASFIVFRKSGGDDSFAALNITKSIMAKKDTVDFYIYDTLVYGAQNYSYFIIPIDALGNKSSASDTVTASSISAASVPLPEYLSTSYPDSGSGIKLNWAVKDTKGINSINIYRSDVWDSLYTLIADLPPDADYYLDADVTPMINYYYQLTLNLKDGSESLPSARVKGIFKTKTPPIPPAIVNAEGTSAGVKLDIICDDLNIEGYRIFRGLGLGDSLRQIGSFVNRTDSITTFVDTSKELSGKTQYSYAAMAENTSHVLSGLSGIVYVRPLIPTNPAAPLFVRAMREGNNISLYWQDVTDIEPTVKSYNVFRKTISDKKGAQFKLINDEPVNSKNNSYNDTLAEADKSYEYAVESVDLFGGKSGLSVSAAVEVNKTTLTPVANLWAESSDNGVLVHWDPVVQPEVTGYKVYRFQAGGSPVVAGTVAKDSFEFKDKKVKKGTLYFYMITTTGKNGTESPYSNEISIRP